ncbi:autotransporter domain-containing protein [Enterobacteriaceae bacterium RIT711]|nr:autotransporter domain-containing protein [Enterobacteriaceae bacterium RIT711]
MITDIVNARHARAALAADTFRVMELQRQALKQLKQRCDTGLQGGLCFRADTGYRTVNHSSDLTSGISLGYGLTDTVSAGFSLGTSLTRDLPQSFRDKGGNGGAGVWTDWRMPDETGTWFMTLGASGSRYKASTVTEHNGHADSGTGTAEMKGWSLSAEGGRELLLSEDVRLKLMAGISRDTQDRQGYSETGNAFPFRYDDVRYRLTYATVGTGLDVVLTPKLRWISQVSGEQDINNKDVTFTAHSEYLGEVTQKASLTHTRWNMASGVEYAVSPLVAFTVMPYAGNSAMGDTGFGGNLSLSGTF